MTLQLTDQAFETLALEVEDIQFLIVNAGGMAAKSLVETILIDRHPDLDRLDARSITNYVTELNRRNWMSREGGGVYWTAQRPEPTIEDYPEVAQADFRVWRRETR